MNGYPVHTSGKGPCGGGLLMSAAEAGRPEVPGQVLCALCGMVQVSAAQRAAALLASREAGIAEVAPAPLRFVGQLSANQRRALWKVADNDLEGRRPAKALRELRALGLISGDRLTDAGEKMVKDAWQLVPRAGETGTP